MTEIQRVTYERLRSLPGYENVRIGAEADVPGDETPEEALESLRVWVEREAEKEAIRLTTPRPGAAPVQERTMPVPTFKAPASGSIPQQLAESDVRMGVRESLPCADCGTELRETRFRDGTVWPPEQLAGYGRRKHNRVLCMEHYRAANEARRRAESTLEEIPF